MHLHFIAIGGAIMHQLAITSFKKGNIITGSDDIIADPAKSNLFKAGLLPKENGWFPEKITKEIDAIILGMHAKEDNPELLKAIELQIPIYSFPEYIYKMSEQKTRIVVAGSHGKTTTTSMIMHVLKKQEIDFDYVVGAKVDGFEYSVKLSDAPVIIIEGDEYPASTIEKRPKIHFYFPHIAVITGIAWDHINVFPTYDNYWRQFQIFLDQMKDGHTIIYNAEDKEVIRLIESEKNDLKNLPYATPSYQIKKNSVVLLATEGNITLNIFGEHNLQNMEAARKVCNTLDVSDEAFYKSFADFKGAARRLEKIHEEEDLIIFRDFAHAPSKLKATLKATRKRFPNHTLIACFELHTFSSLNKDFLREYEHSMDDCNFASVFYTPQTLASKNMPDLDPQLIKSSFNREDLKVFDHKESLRNWISQEISDNGKRICLLLMSSGTFEGMDMAFNLKNTEKI